MVLKKSDVVEGNKILGIMLGAAAVTGLIGYAVRRAQGFTLTNRNEVDYARMPVYAEAPHLKLVNVFFRYEDDVGRAVELSSEERQFLNDIASENYEFIVTDISDDEIEGYVVHGGGRTYMTIFRDEYDDDDSFNYAEEEVSSDTIQEWIDDGEEEEGYTVYEEIVDDEDNITVVEKPMDYPDWLQV